MLKAGGTFGKRNNKEHNMSLENTVKTYELGLEGPTKKETKEVKENKKKA